VRARACDRVARRLIHLAELHAASSSALIVEQLSTATHTPRSRSHIGATTAATTANSAGAGGGGTSGGSGVNVGAAGVLSSRALSTFVELDLPATALAATATMSASAERDAQLLWARVLAVRVPLVSCCDVVSGVRDLALCCRDTL
jgi:hypothetical protein